MRLALMFQVVAVVLFLLCALLVFVIDPIDWKLVGGFACLGLASHAAGHLPI